jgi:hypothetical protein
MAAHKTFWLFSIADLIENTQRDYEMFSVLFTIYEPETASRYSDRLRAGVRFPAEAGDYSLLHSIQTGSGAHSGSYRMGREGSFPGVKRPGREVDHSSPSSVKVKNGGAVPLRHTTSRRYA